MIRDGDVLNALTETVRRFVRERLLPAEARVDEEDAIPSELTAAMRELGLFGMSIPEQYGGLGLTMEEEVLESWPSSSRGKQQLDRTSLR